MFKARRLPFVKSSDIINFFSFFFTCLFVGVDTKKKKEFEMKCLLVQKRVRIFLLLAASTTVFLTTTPKKVESKCLDKCQFIPSVEWREQCNTCLEIPCRRCAPFSFVLFALSVYFYRWCSFSAYIYEGIERGCGLYCEGYVNPRGYEQKQFVRYGTGFVPVRYDINPGYLARG